MKEYLEHPEKFSNLEKRVYRCFLRKRVEQALKELEYVNEKILDNSLSIKIMGKSDRPSKPGVGGSSPPGPVLNAFYMTPLQDSVTYSVNESFNVFILGFYIFL